MNGAQSLVKTLLASDVDVCFANPGTSEMHLVAALDEHPEMRCVLCLFEGGTSGAADGYARMSGKVAATLLHLAPGFGNSYANVHNARKAGTGMVNVVGDHADYHLKYDSPLKGNIEGVAGAVSHWVRVSPDARAVAGDGADAVRAARAKNGQIATLILPANTAWEAADGVAVATPPAPLNRPSEAQIAQAAEALKAPGAALLVGGAGVYGEGAELAGKIATAAGCRLIAGLQNARFERGAGAVPIERQPYVVEQNVAFLADLSTIVLCGGQEPVSFFAYPGKPSLPAPVDCAIMDLCDSTMDVLWTLGALVDALGANDVEPPRSELNVAPAPTGAIEVEKLGPAIAAHLPAGMILSDEAVTIGRGIAPALETAPRHDLLTTTGGAIGQCLPAAVGAAVACPDRKVLAMTGDGSAMYTLQSLWTMARENLDITVIVFANRGYQILRGELANVGVETVGRNAVRMLDVDDPTLDWVSLAKGHGVAGERVTDMEGFNAALPRGLAMDGPYLIEVVC